MNGHVLELCDVVVSQAGGSARGFNLTLDQIVIRKLYYSCEDDRLVFELCVSGDESKIDEFWDAVVNNISDHGSKMSKEARAALMKLSRCSSIGDDGIVQPRGVPSHRHFPRPERFI